MIWPHLMLYFDIVMWSFANLGPVIFYAAALHWCIFKLQYMDGQPCCDFIALVNIGQLHYNDFHAILRYTEAVVYCWLLDCFIYSFLTSLNLKRTAFGMSWNLFRWCSCRMSLTVNKSWKCIAMSTECKNECTQQSL